MWHTLINQLASNKTKAESYMRPKAKKAHISNKIKCNNKQYSSI